MSRSPPRAASPALSIPPVGPRMLGTLIIILIKARNLPNKVRIGKQAPYATIQFGLTKKKTVAIERGGQFPTWDEEFRLEMPADMNDLAQADQGLTLTKAGGLGNVGGKGKGKDSLPPPPPQRSTKRLLRLACYADDPRDPKLIGETMIDLDPIIKKGASDEWWELRKADRYSGEVYIEMTFWSNGPAPVKQARGPSPSASVYVGPGERASSPGSEGDPRRSRSRQGSSSSLTTTFEIAADYPDADINPLAHSVSALSLQPQPHNGSPYSPHPPTGPDRGASYPPPNGWNSQQSSAYQTRPSSVAQHPIYHPRHSLEYSSTGFRAPSPSPAPYPGQQVPYGQYGAPQPPPHRGSSVPLPVPPLPIPPQPPQASAQYHYNTDAPYPAPQSQYAQPHHQVYQTAPEPSQSAYGYQQPPPMVSHHSSASLPNIGGPPSGSPYDQRAYSPAPPLAPSYGRPSSGYQDPATSQVSNGYEELAQQHYATVNSGGGQYLGHSRSSSQLAGGSPAPPQSGYYHTLPPQSPQHWSSPAAAPPHPPVPPTPPPFPHFAPPPPPPPELESSYGHQDSYSHSQVPQQYRSPSPAPAPAMPYYDRERRTSQRLPLPPPPAPPMLPGEIQHGGYAQAQGGPPHHHYQHQQLNQGYGDQQYGASLPPAGQQPAQDQAYGQGQGQKQFGNGNGGAYGSLPRYNPYYVDG